MTGTYDQENRLVTVSQNGLTSTHTYDGLGRRATTAKSGKTIRYHYDADGRLLFTTDSGGTLTAYYFYAGPRLVATRDQQGNFFYYHADKNGNIIALTDASGNTIASYAYTPFGEKLLHSGSTTNIFTYVGAWGVIDDGNNLYYMKNRYYNAATGRFLQKDPLRFAAGTNAYAYGNNNPTKYIDPDGTFYREAGAGTAASFLYYAAAATPTGWGAAGVFFAGYTLYSVGSNLYDLLARVPQGAEANRAIYSDMVDRVNNDPGRYWEEEKNYRNHLHRDMHDSCVNGFNLYMDAQGMGIPTGGNAGVVVEGVNTIVTDVFSPEYMNNASDTENIGDPDDYSEEGE